LVVFNENSSNKGINIVSISLNLDIVKIKVSLSLFNLPHPKKGASTKKICLPIGKEL
jgi:hypothetical protein